MQVGYVAGGDRLSLMTGKKTPMSGHVAQNKTSCDRYEYHMTQVTRLHVADDLWHSPEYKAIPPELHMKATFGTAIRWQDHMWQVKYLHVAGEDRLRQVRRAHVAQKRSSCGRLEDHMCQVRRLHVGAQKTIGTAMVR